MKFQTSDFFVSEAWQTSHPGASAGILVMSGGENHNPSATLDYEKEGLENSLRSRYADYTRPMLENLPILQVYNAYYNGFKKTYHLQLQLESIIHKGKNIPSTLPLVQAMFMAEMKNLLLTAGHDAQKLQLPIKLDTAAGTENYTVMRGHNQQLKAGDMYMTDSRGVISSILYGPDQRTQISPDTSDVAYTVYAPCGISEDALMEHLHDIEKYVLISSPAASVDLLKVYR